MIHLVYPHRDRISAPDVIGSTLARHLSKRHAVMRYDIDAVNRIDPQPGDILIGHAHPFARTVFRRSLRNPKWSRRILMQPFNGDWNQIDFIDEVIDDCDQFLAITGSYWFDKIPLTPAARWEPKMVHVDLAVNRQSFPRLKRDVPPKGSRKVVYIGNDHPGKNLAYLDAVAAQWGGTIDWIGSGSSLKHLKPMGFVDFSTAEGQSLLQRYDILITLGSADANPTTVLEALSWGLVPVCTPTSGYVGEKCIINVPGDDVAEVCRVLDGLQAAEAVEIDRLRAEGEARLDQHYNWGRFVRQVEEAIESSASPLIAARTQMPHVARRLRLKPAMRVLLKNIVYFLEKAWPGMRDGRTVMRLRNLLKM